MANTGFDYHTRKIINQSIAILIASYVCYGSLFIWFLIVMSPVLFSSYSWVILLLFAICLIQDAILSTVYLKELNFMHQNNEYPLSSNVQQLTYDQARSAYLVNFEKRTKHILSFALFGAIFEQSVNWLLVIQFLLYPSGSCHMLTEQQCYFGQVAAIMSAVNILSMVWLVLCCALFGIFY